MRVFAQDQFETLVLCLLTTTCTCRSSVLQKACPESIFKRIESDEDPQIARVFIFKYAHFELLSSLVREGLETCVPY